MSWPRYLTSMVSPSKIRNTRAGKGKSGACASEAASSVEASYLSSGLGRGLYRAAVDFDCAGEWGAEISMTLEDGSTATERLRFSVHSGGSAPAIGVGAIVAGGRADGIERDDPDGPVRARAERFLSGAVEDAWADLDPELRGEQTDDSASVALVPCSVAMLLSVPQAAAVTQSYASAPRHSSSTIR